MNLIINIKNNAIREILAKKSLHALNEIKKTKIRNKRLISSQKKLINFFNEFFEAIYFVKKEKNNNNNNRDNNSDDNNNVSESESESKSLNDSESKCVDANHDNNNKDEDEDEIKNINNHFKTIDESAPLEEQINLLRIMDDISRYWHMSYYDDDKDLNLRIFNLKYLFLVNELDEKLFEKIFGHTFVTLANKVINTTNKQERQIIINDIRKNKDKLYEHDGFHNYMIESSSKRIDIINAAKIILKFNEAIQLDED